MKSNKHIGNRFETEFCESLADKGFWAHNMAQNQAGQPADVIAVKDGIAYLIDCKVCTNNLFSKSRIEENQRNAMTLWETCGNGGGWFAVKLDDEIYMVELWRIDMSDRKTLNVYWFRENALTLEKWMVTMS